MPEYDEETKLKLATLEALPPHTPGIDVCEAMSIYWPDGTRHYACAAYDDVSLAPWMVNAIPLRPIELRIITEKGRPFFNLPRFTAGDDVSVEVTFSDFDGVFSGLFLLHGEGVKVEIFYYFPKVDLLLSMWLGHLALAGDFSRAVVKASVRSGFKDAQGFLPRRQRITSCAFIFGGHLDTQDAITFHAGCPHNAHLTEEERGGAPLIGVPGFTDCPRAVVGDCYDRMTEPDTEIQTKKFWPGFDVRPDPIANNQTSGPNLLASAAGNISNLSEPIRVIAGERYVKALALLASRAEVDTNHADKGFASGLFEIGEGPLDAFWEFRINSVFVGMEHQNIRLGELGQPPTFFSPNVPSFSGTAHGFGRIQGNFNAQSAAQLTGSGRARGLKNVRVYSDSDTFTEQYTTNRADWLLRVMCDARWGQGYDYSRYDIASVIDTRQWCNDNVSMHDPNGNLFTGPRSTFNAELRGRSTTQQLNDICVAGRIAPPFEFQGKEVFVPLRKEDLSDPSSIPTFTDTPGDNCNIFYDDATSSLIWSPISDKTLVNQWTVNFDDSSNGGVESQLQFGDEGQQLRAGRAFGDRTIHVVPGSQAAFGITNFSEAARFGVTLLYLGPLDAGGIANGFTIKFTTWYSRAFEVRNYKVIRVLNPKLQSHILLHFAQLNMPHFAGVPYEYFRVTKFERRGDLKVDIEAVVYPQDFYEAIEDVTVPPPIFVAPPTRNPGGRRDEQPESLGLESLALDRDRIIGRIARSSLGL